MSMGLEISLQDGQGHELVSVTDRNGYLMELLPVDDDDNHPLLASIDRNGETIFNRIQMKRFLSEWADVARSAQAMQQHALISAVESLARRCQDGPHLFLKFAGD